MNNSIDQSRTLEEIGTSCRELRDILSDDHDLLRAIEATHHDRVTEVVVKKSHSEFSMTFWLFFFWLWLLVCGGTVVIQNNN